MMINTKMNKTSFMKTMKNLKPFGRKQKKRFLEGIVVQSLTGDTIMVNNLWENNTVILKVLRRFGCPLCRYESRLLSDLKPYFDELNVKLIGIGFEEVGLQEFIDGKYWDWDLYLDTDRAVHKALGLTKMSIVQGLSDLLTFATRTAVKAANSIGISGDIYGDGFQLGGTFIVGPGNTGLLYEYRQTSSAVFPSIKEMFKICGGDPSIIDEVSPQECLFYTESIAPKSVANTEASSKKSYRTAKSGSILHSRVESTSSNELDSILDDLDDVGLPFNFNDVDSEVSSFKKSNVMSYYSDDDSDDSDYLSAS